MFVLHGISSFLYEAIFIRFIGCFVCILRCFMSRMQRLSSKINYDVLEKLFDESVCASPYPKFLENSIIPSVTFNFYSDVNSFGRLLFSSFRIFSFDLN